MTTEKLFSKNWYLIVFIEMKVGIDAGINLLPITSITKTRLF